MALTAHPVAVGAASWRARALRWSDSDGVAPSGARRRHRAGRDRSQGLLLPFPRHGKRAQGLNCELFTIDTALLDGRRAGCRPVVRLDTELGGRDPRLADRFCRREVDRRWALNEAPPSAGWKPRRGFMPYRWTGCQRGPAALSSAGFADLPLPAESYAAWL